MKKILMGIPFGIVIVTNFMFWAKSVLFSDGISSDQEMYEYLSSLGRLIAVNFGLISLALLVKITGKDDWRD